MQITNAYTCDDLELKAEVSRIAGEATLENWRETLRQLHTFPDAYEVLGVRAVCLRDQWASRTDEFVRWALRNVRMMETDWYGNFAKANPLPGREGK